MSDIRHSGGSLVFNSEQLGSATWAAHARLAWSLIALSIVITVLQLVMVLAPRQAFVRDARDIRLQRYFGSFDACRPMAAAALELAVTSYATD